MSIGAIVPANGRGCGRRKSDCVYLESGLSPYGRPLEYFLVDSPNTDVPDSVIPLGVKILPREQQCVLCNQYDFISQTYSLNINPNCSKCHGTGKYIVYHIWDQVGTDNYPNVLDFVEEVRNFGLSRKIAKTADFSLLTQESRWIGVHPRAHVDNAKEWYDFYSSWYCPKQKPEHKRVDDPNVCCAGFWWDDIVEGESTMNPNIPREVVRHLPSFSYEACSRPPDIEPVYKRAIFISLPLTRLVVVRGEKHMETLKDMEKSSLPCEVVDE